MNYILVIWVILLFLPSLNQQTSTDFGTLQLSDYLIVPYVLLLVLHTLGDNDRIKTKLHIDKLTPLLLVFFWWAVNVTLLIPFRYNYPNNHQLVFSLLKLGKLGLYGLAGILTIRTLAKTGGNRQVDWMVFGAALVTGIGLLLTRFFAVETASLSDAQVDALEYADNATGSTMAILISYLLGRYLSGSGSSWWRRVTLPGIVVMVISALLSRGRAGILALLIATVYMLIRYRLKNALIMVLIGVAVVLVTYDQSSVFRQQAERTFQARQADRTNNQSSLFGIDTFGRLESWRNDLAKYTDDPILGRGFFHRGGLSRLTTTGSHNFYIQMFLETGFVGGLLTLLMFLGMWTHAGSQYSAMTQAEIPTRSAVLAAFVVGMSGEYFYGGLALFALFLTYGAVGRLPIVEGQKVLRSQSTVAFP